MHTGKQATGMHDFRERPWCPGHQENLTMSQPCAPVAKQVNSLLGYIKKTIALVRHIWTAGSSSGFPGTTEIWTCW